VASGRRSWSPMKSNTDSVSSFIRFIQLKSLRARTQESYLNRVSRVAWKFRHGDVRTLLYQGQESSVPTRWLHIFATHLFAIKKRSNTPTPSRMKSQDSTSQHRIDCRPTADRESTHKQQQISAKASPHRQNKRSKAGQNRTIRKPKQRSTSMLAHQGQADQKAKRIRATRFDHQRK
jgi:hypothetical protein